MKIDKKITFKLFLALFGITMIFYWIYTPLYYNASFFDGILAPFIDILTSGGIYGSEQLLTGHRYDVQFFETFMLQTSYLILPFFGIAGIFFWLSRKDELKFSVAFISGLSVLPCLCHTYARHTEPADRPVDSIPFGFSGNLCSLRTLYPVLK